MVKVVNLQQKFDFGTTTNEIEQGLIVTNVVNFI